MRLAPALLALAVGAPLAGCIGPTPTPVLTATPLPTPTATAPPLLVADDLRSRVEAAPEPAAGAPCGVVDVLDAPLGPPDGEGFVVRWPYGRVSRRYQGKLHAGEDWLIRRGQSLGQPVHAIGHGQVTYAEPLGWGSDQGVVIVRHVVAGGDTFLSFYGHMEPTSITLAPGQCVVRGDRVGAIGRPRSTPHLHFEIRTHLPTTPGPGYWPSDPAAQGWRPPSAFIAGERLRTAPGVLWTLPYTETRAVVAGRMPDDTLVMLERERALVGRGLADGEARWRLALEAPARAAVLDVGGAIAYAALRGGGVQALALPPADAPLWTVEPAAGRGAVPLLIPLPDGGVAVHDGLRLIGLDRQGARAWVADDVPAVAGWAVDGRRLVVAPATVGARGGGAAPEAAPEPAALRAIGGLALEVVPVAGQPLAAGDNLLVYGPGGVWRALGDGARAELRYALDAGIVDDGSIVAAPDGGAIVAHRDPRGMRLIALGADGGHRWDRALADVGRRTPRLLRAAGRVLLVSADGEVLQVDPATGAARRLLAAGSAAVGDAPWAFAAPDGRLVVRVGDRLVGFDPSRIEP